jgi:DNA-binding CsgD family transcriptional regulator
MNDITNGKDGEGNISGDIKREAELKRQREQILQRWVEGKSPGQIATEIDLPVGIVYGHLKWAQKEWVVEQGGEHYVKRGEF